MHQSIVLVGLLRGHAERLVTCILVAVRGLQLVVKWIGIHSIVVVELLVGRLSRATAASVTSIDACSYI